MHCRISACDVIEKYDKKFSSLFEGMTMNEKVYNDFQDYLDEQIDQSEELQDYYDLYNSLNAQEFYEYAIKKNIKNKDKFVEKQLEKTEDPIQYPYAPLALTIYDYLYPHLYDHYEKFGLSNEGNACYQNAILNV